ncbi:MAG: twin-arginine translocase TatA/TatE family subunit [Verrucomicrobiales bacterium]|nr:twin-arginine translocase TatA/TatE family subunit [Verrucomicrobiales bacterium]MBR89972.1 twin-arginine translocase TatA/TatE family subunit [Verrucomicrobiales bacterium]
MGLGMGEVILILAIVLIMFGAKKLPELAKGLGKGIKEFKRASTDIQDEMDRTYYEEDHRTHRPESGERVAKETSSKDDAVTVESTTESDTSKT